MRTLRFLIFMLLSGTRSTETRGGRVLAITEIQSYPAFAY
ncbi:Uncharacterized protein dnm_066210 [Desulfonema magnum]|uniref:Uncharacterized protein n=1 Tax=Desulfonema magnum TaxID=45655 RepID=A0A975BS00_9BACT|nr:Uncharacterized protein dnm_066210 [Desulfonema magnum]